MAEKLNIGLTLLEKIKQHGEAAYPNECCGFFYGLDSDGVRNILEVIAVRNAREGDQRRRFEIDPLDYIKAEKYALENNFSLLGVYHSHPDHPAIPSVHDWNQAQPFFSYLIVSIEKGEAVALRSWRLNDKNEFEEEQTNELQTLNK